MRRRDTARVVLRGSIAGAGFASGDRFVVGLWASGPLGPMTDVMWAKPDGTRVLLAPSEDVGAFVSAVYNFDMTKIVSISVREGRDGFSLEAGPLALEITAGRPRWVFRLRPRLLRRSLLWVRMEDALLRRVVGRLVLGGAEGVRAFGTTTAGVKEWYRIDGYQPIVAASASLDGRDLGALRPLRPKLGFGFSEFPIRPAIVRCSPVLEGPISFFEWGPRDQRSRLQ